MEWEEIKEIIRIMAKYKTLKTKVHVSIVKELERLIDIKKVNFKIMEKTRIEHGIYEIKLANGRW